MAKLLMKKKKLSENNAKLKKPNNGKLVKEAMSKLSSEELKALKEEFSNSGKKKPSKIKSK